MNATAEVLDRTAAVTRWRRPLVIGLVVDAALCLFVMVLVGELIPPLVVFLVAFAGLALATSRTERRWPQVVTVVAAVIFIGGNLPFIVEDLSHPDSFASFAPMWLLLVATIFVAAGAVMVHRRSPAPPTMPVLACAAVALIGVAGSAVASISVEDDARLAGDVVVVAKDVEYPREVIVSAGPTAVFLENRDIFRHTFVVEGQDIKQELPASTDRRLELDLPPGSYVFSCDVPGHEQMKGTLVVE